MLTLPPLASRFGLLTSASTLGFFKLTLTFILLRIASATSRRILVRYDTSETLWIILIILCSITRSAPETPVEALVTIVSNGRFTIIAPDSAVSERLLKAEINFRKPFEKIGTVFGVMEEELRSEANKRLILILGVATPDKAFSVLINVFIGTRRVESVEREVDPTAVPRYLFIIWFAFSGLIDRDSKLVVKPLRTEELEVEVDDPQPRVDTNLRTQITSTELEQDELELSVVLRLIRRELSKALIA